jgi:hypothetical protein
MLPISFYVAGRSASTDRKIPTRIWNKKQNYTPNTLINMDVKTSI